MLNKFGKIRKKVNGEELRDKIYLSRVCIYLAETALWEGKLLETEEWLTQCLNYRMDPRWIGFAMVNALFVTARLAAAQQAYKRAAILFGMAEALRISTHCTLVEPVRAQIDAAVMTVREFLGAERFAEDFASGQKLSFDEALTTVLAR